MKKLSIEEKAKRYDEVINRMKHYVIDEYGCSRIKVVDVFPELKESEDERIRKEILDYIIKGSESCYDIQQYGREKFEKWIAWLKKQGKWSEEDEEMYRKCICVMRASACGFPEEEKFVEQLDNWFKSLKDRHSWKPSDEQIEALKQAKTDACGKPYFNALASLYINLKGY